MTESPSSPPSRLVTFDLDDLYRQRAEVAERLAGLDGAIRVAEEMLGRSSRDAASVGPASGKAPTRRPTQRAMLLSVLGEAAGPLGVRGMIDGIEVRFGERIPRTSVSPLLRKLAAKGEVKHDPGGASWTLGAVDQASVEREVRGEVVTFRGPKTARREVA